MSCAGIFNPTGYDRFHNNDISVGICSKKSHGWGQDRQTGTNLIGCS